MIMWIYKPYNKYLFLNIDKRESKHFVLNNLIDFKYSIANFNFELVFTFKYLSLLFDSKLNFFNHVKMIKNKAILNLGYV